MLSRSTYFSVLATLAWISSTPAAAQLTTKCFPLKETCPPDPGLGTAHNFIFNSTPPSGVFNTTAGTVDYDAENGAALTVRQKGDAPTLISNFYFFWGRTEVIMKAAPGRGIISSIVWSSDVLDEVDWEFFGTNSTHASSNYFGKNNTDFGNGGYHGVKGSIQDWHNYTSVWTKDSLEWWVDGDLVRTLLPKDANNTLYYPQTPMKLSLGIWAGGDSDGPAGRVAWAGGETDYSQGPFTMYVKSALVEDYSTGKEYSYSDNSGSFQSIKIAEGNSTAVENINKPPEKSLSQKWNDLPAGAKTGVYAGAASLGSLLFIALIFYYLKQRRNGKREAALAVQRNEQDRVELERFKKEGRNPDALDFDGTEYHGAAGAKGGASVGTYAVHASPPGSSAGLPEKAWDPVGSSSYSATPAMPLLHDQGSSRRVASPGQGFAVLPLRNNSTNSFASPIHAHGPDHRHDSPRQYLP